MITTHTRNGYVFLLSVLFVGSVAAATTVTLIVSGLTAERGGKAVQDGVQALEYARTCADAALQALKDDPSYIGDTLLTFGDDNKTCDIYPIGGSGNANRTICVDGRVGDLVRLMQVSVQRLYPITKITDWKEVSSVSSLCTIQLAVSSSSSEESSASSSDESSSETSSSGSCGNSTVEPGEQCDGGDFANNTCPTLGYIGGNLGCNPDCTFDVSQCHMCGNGYIEGSEQCDSTNFNYQTCNSFGGFYEGSLSCNADCTLNTSACHNCGNGVCTADQGETAQSCPADCQLCGNGGVNDGEQCDGNNLNAQSCTSQGFTAGTLQCSSGCLFDTSQCNYCGDGQCNHSEDSTSCVQDCPLCGNGAINAGEECEGVNLQNASCVSLQFVGGTLSCNASCTYDTSQCHMCGNAVCDSGETFDSCPGDCPLCGNGTVNAGENCDGVNLSNQTCQGVGYASGTLSCNNDCTFNTSQCVACGNNVVDSPEQCDGSAFNGATCHLVNSDFQGGTLTCNNDCTYNTSQCHTCGNGACDNGETIGSCAQDCQLCGNNVINGVEQCDGSSLNNQTCVSQGYVAGTLSCGNDCQFNVSQCNNCGDGQVQQGEACDDGNTSSNDYCASDCSATTGYCGDNLLQSNVEQCDDGSTNNGDGCNSTCQEEYCGDGIINDSTEQCDSGLPYYGPVGNPACWQYGYTYGSVYCYECVMDLSQCF